MEHEIVLNQEEAKGATYRLEELLKAQERTMVRIKATLKEMNAEVDNIGKGKLVTVPVVGWWLAYFSSKRHFAKLASSYKVNASFYNATLEESMWLVEALLNWVEYNEPKELEAINGLKKLRNEKKRLQLEV